MARRIAALALILVSLASPARAHGPIAIAPQPGTQACICSGVQDDQGLIDVCLTGTPYYGPLLGEPYPPEAWLLQIVKLEQLVARLRAELAAGH